MVPNSVLRENARKQLGDSIFSNTWLMTMVAYVIYSLIVSAAAGVSCGIVTLIISGPLLYGFNRICVKLVKGYGKVNLEDLFVGFTENFTGALVLHLMTSLYIFLWSLLFVIPGIVKMYSYAMAPYILQDDPTKDWEDCINESREMMQGNRWQLFCLEFSFIGWFFVGALCCGIGVFFVAPYQSVARANFYMALKAQNEPRGFGQDPDFERVDPFAN